MAEMEDGFSPPRMQLRGKWIVSLVKFQIDAPWKRWHLWKID